jgi:peptide/nickel transport system substrate-binding protein
MFLKKKTAVVLISLVFLVPITSGCKFQIPNLKKLNTVKNKKTVVKQQKTTDAVTSDYVILSMDHPATLNPILNKDKDVEDIFKLSYLGLIKYDCELKVAPSLAESWEYDKNENTIAVNINRDARWSNGEDVSAEDVEYTINKIIASQNSSPYYPLLSNLDSCYVNSNDSKQIILKLKVWDTSFIDNLFFPIVNKKFYQDNGIYAVLPSPADGPYRIKDYDGTKELDMETNSNYIGYMPSINKIKVYILPDEKTKINMFEESQIDAINVLPENISDEDGLTSRYIKFCNNEIVLVGFNFNNKIFANKKTRQAIAYLINRKELVDKVFIGNAILNDKPFISGTYLQKNPFIKYNYLPQRAENIFEKLNYRDYNNGFLEIKNGKQTTELRMNILVKSNDKKILQTAEEVRNYLIKAGIKSNLDIADSNGYTDKIKSKKYDLCILNYNLGYDNDLQQLLGANNLLGYKNQSIQNLLNDLKISENEDEKKEIYTKIGELYLNELPYINIFFKSQDLYINSKVSGEVKPNSYQSFGELGKWKLK